MSKCFDQRTAQRRAWLLGPVVVAGMAGRSLSTLHDVPDDFASIGAAVDAAAIGDTVRIAPGLWTENLELGEKGLLLTGTAPGNPAIVAQTVIDGSAEVAPTVWIGGTGTLPLRLRGLTVQGGAGALVSTPHWRRIGGGVYCESGELTIDHCRIADNRFGEGSAAGGGIFVGEAGELLLQASTVVGNRADEGGGLAIEGGSAVLRMVRIAHNNAADGGGARVSGSGRLDAENCIFEANGPVQIDYMGLGGGAISCRGGGEVRLNSCGLFDNNAENGGAVICGGYFEMRGGTIASNRAASDGGGLRILGSGAADLENVVIARNWAFWGGGAVRKSGGELRLEWCTVVMNGGGGTIVEQSGTGSTRITNSIVWRNGPFPALKAGTGSICVRYSDVEGGYDGEGNIDADPLFCTLPCGGSKVSIAAESPCVGSGIDGSDIGAGVVGCESGYEPQRSVWTVPGDHQEIQAAIDGSCDGDTVRVYPGVWNESIDFGGKAIVLAGSAPYDSAIVDQTIILGAAESVVRITQGEPEGTEVLGIRIRGGWPWDNRDWSDAYGGGLFVNSASLAIRHCVIDSNRASAMGGAMWGHRAELAVSDSRIERNRASGNGGGFVLRYCDTRLLRCRIAHNRSDAGAGIYVAGGSSEIYACRIEHNSTYEWEGGGMCITGGARVGIHNSIIFNNEIPEYYLGRSAKGGGIAIDGRSTVDLRFSVISRNRCASWAGGGIAVQSPATLQAQGAVLWSNASGGITWGTDLWTWSQDAAQLSYSLGPEGLGGEGNVLGPPNFVTWRGHDFVLSPGKWSEGEAALPRSPGIDAGPPHLSDWLDWPKGYDNGRRSDIGIYGGPGGVLWIRKEEN